MWWWAEGDWQSWRQDPGLCELSPSLGGRTVQILLADSQRPHSYPFLRLTSSERAHITGPHPSLPSAGTPPAGSLPFQPAKGHSSRCGSNLRAGPWVSVKVRGPRQRGHSARTRGTGPHSTLVLHCSLCDVRQVPKHLLSLRSLIYRSRK